MPNSVLGLMLAVGLLEQLRAGSGTSGVSSSSSVFLSPLEGACLRSMSAGRRPCALLADEHVEPVGAFCRASFAEDEGQQADHGRRPDTPIRMGTIIGIHAWYLSCLRSSESASCRSSSDPLDAICGIDGHVDLNRAAARAPGTCSTAA